MDDLPAVEPIKIYENTYRMPSEATRFKKSSAEKIMKAVLEDKMAYTNERDGKGRFAWTYNKEEVDDVANEIVATCLEQIKEDAGPMPRFKLICQASVGESLGQSLRMASRCLWDEQIDSSASATWTNSRVYAVVTCWALYYE